MAAETLTPEMLIYAYAQGFFPMAEPDTGDIYWYDPDPRTIIPLDGLHVSRSLRRVLRKNIFTISYDQCFSEVMRACAAPAPGRATTWINDELIELYTALFNMGFAHSIEVWQDDCLVGGLYGVSIGGLFAGESMFSRVSNSSKVALVTLTRHLRQRGYSLFDVQFMTEHLRRFGALEIPQQSYKRKLAKAIHQQVLF
ncbi:MAG: leucyl/phenylalanyl-tRNA--protein transferase [Deinococcota bacterium]